MFFLVFYCIFVVHNLSVVFLCSAVHVETHTHCPFPGCLLSFLSVTHTQTAVSILFTLPLSVSQTHKYIHTASYYRLLSDVHKSMLCMPYHRVIDGWLFYSYRFYALHILNGGNGAESLVE